jgi:hypothetical protein
MSSRSGIPQKRSPEEIQQIFAQLDPHAVEQFYAGYQLWALQKQLHELQTRIENVQSQMKFHHEEMQRLSPTPIALASLALLQSHGVNDPDLLDRMLERGEEWLDSTMQRLVYCEQMNFIQDDNYTQWCELALEGAYDWISSIQLHDVSAPPLFPEAEISEGQDTTSAELLPPTEEMLLHKLMSEDAPEAETTLNLHVAPNTVSQESKLLPFSVEGAPVQEDIEAKETIPEQEVTKTAQVELNTDDQPVDVEQVETSQQPVPEHDAADVPEYSRAQIQGQQAPARKRSVFGWIVYILFGR